MHVTVILQDMPNYIDHKKYTYKNNLKIIHLKRRKDQLLEYKVMKQNGDHALAYLSN